MWPFTKKSKTVPITRELILELFKESELPITIVDPERFHIWGIDCRGDEAVLFNHEENFYLATVKGFIISCDQNGKELNPDLVTEEEINLKSKIFPGKIISKKKRKVEHLNAEIRKIFKRSYQTIWKRIWHNESVRLGKNK